MVSQDRLQEIKLMKVPPVLRLANLAECSGRAGHGWFSESKGRQSGKGIVNHFQNSIIKYWSSNDRLCHILITEIDGSFIFHTEGACGSIVGDTPPDSSLGLPKHIKFG